MHLISIQLVKYWICYCCLVSKLYPTLCNPMDCSPPGSSVHGISQARILVCVAISFFRGSSPPRDRTCISCIGRSILCHWATGEAWHHLHQLKMGDVNLLAFHPAIPLFTHPFHRPLAFCGDLFTDWNFYLFLLYIWRSPPSGLYKQLHSFLAPSYFYSRCREMIMAVEDLPAQVLASIHKGCNQKFNT